MLDQLWFDLRHAARSLGRTRGFTAAAVATLALGIGANTAIFSLLDELLIRPLPVNAPDELFALREGDYSYSAYQTFRRDAGDIIDVFASAPIERVQADANGPLEPVSLALVSGTYFPVLGVRASIGRTFTTDDERAEIEPVAVVSWAFWQSRMGGERSVIGRRLRIGASTATIVGVAPASFAGERAGTAPDLWMPLAMRSRIITGRDLLASPTASWLAVAGRLRPGVSIARAESMLTAQYQRVRVDALGPILPPSTLRAIQQEVVSLVPAATGIPTGLRSRFGTPLTIAMAGVGLLLMLACANVSNLMLARGAARRRDVAIRLALAGSWTPVMRGVFVESLLLAGAGAVAGMGVAWLIRAAIVGIIAADADTVLGTALNLRVLAFTIAVSVATTVLAGLGPAWQTRSVSPKATLGRRLVLARPPRPRLTGMLAVAQIAISLVLFGAAALFVRTLLNLHAEPLGYATDRLVLVDVEPRAAGYEGARYTELVVRLEARMRDLPGVASASSTANGVLSGRDSGTTRIGPVALANGPDVQFPPSRYDQVGPDYFTTMNIPLVAGRAFDERDRQGTPNVVVVNDAMARAMFAGTSAVGQRLRWTERDGQFTDWDIIGVVGDVRQSGPREAIRARFYLPARQHTEDAYPTTLVLRTSLGATAAIDLVREAVRLEDPAVPIQSVTTGADLFGRSVVRERLLVLVAGAFAVLATVLAALGIYGLLAFSVRLRRQELAVRLAVGARPTDITRLMLGTGAKLVGGGVLVGTLMTIAGLRIVSSLLFGVTAGDVPAHAAAGVLLTLVGLVACYVPARRAATTNPMRALRSE